MFFFLIIDQLFLDLINTFDFINNLASSIRTILIDIKTIKFVYFIFMYFGVSSYFFPSSVVLVFVQFFCCPWILVYE